MNARPGEASWRFTAWPEPSPDQSPAGSRVQAPSPRQAGPLCASLRGCKRPAEGGNLCRGCRFELRSALAGLPGLLAELQVTVSRQSVTSGRGGGDKPTKAAEEALLFDVDAADMDWAVRNTVAAWARHVVAHRYGRLAPVSAGPVCVACFHDSCAGIRALAAVHRDARPPAHFAALCGWLAGHISWLNQQPEAAQAHDELTSIRPFTTRAVDNREDRYAGPCTAPALVEVAEVDGQVTAALTDRACGADLRARNGAQLITCRTCGAKYDALERAEWIIAKSDDEAATAADIAAAFADAGLVRSAEQLRKRINTWAARSRQWIAAARSWQEGDPPLVYERHPIVAAGGDAAGRPVFRIGDIRERLQAAQEPTPSERIGA